MSYASISRNNDAISFVDDAIDKYYYALEKIKVDNENTLSDELIKHIEDSIGLMLDLKGQLNSINSRINRAMKEKEEREAEARRREEEESTRWREQKERERQAQNQNSGSNNNVGGNRNMTF